MPIKRLFKRESLGVVTVDRAIQGQRQRFQARWDKVDKRAEDQGYWQLVSDSGGTLDTIEADTPEEAIRFYRESKGQEDAYYDAYYVIDQIIGSHILLAKPEVG